MPAIGPTNAAHLKRAPAVRPRLALHIGAMGVRGKNFYHALETRYRFASEADDMQDRFLAGNRERANRTVTDATVDDLAVVGPSRQVADRLCVAVGGRCPP